MSQVLGACGIFQKLIAPELSSPEIIFAAIAKNEQDSFGGWI